MIKFEELKKNDKGEYVNKLGKVISKQNAEVIEQHNMPFEELLAKLKFTPLRRNILTLAIPDDDVNSSLYVGTSGNVSKENKDATNFPMKVLAVAYNSNHREVIKPGDYIHVIQGQAYKVNGVHIIDCQDHEVIGKFEV